MYGYVFRVEPLGSDPRVGYVFAAGPTPTLDSLTPATAMLGDPNFTLHCLGTNFTPDTKILWNGSEEPTVFVSETELTTDVNMATATVAAPIPVAVRGPSGGVTAPLIFDLTAAG
jgi:hypothetical protein